MSLFMIANAGASATPSDLPLPAHMPPSAADLAWARGLFDATRAGQPRAATPAPAAPRPNAPTDRNAAIDAATLPGTEALAAQLKADPTVSAPDAALALAARYRTLKGIAAPSGGTALAHALPRPARGQSEADADFQQGADSMRAFTRGSLMESRAAEGWRSEWTASAELQRDFDSADSYANWKAAEASGRVRIYGGSGVIRGGR